MTILPRWRPALIVLTLALMISDLIGLFGMAPGAAMSAPPTSLPGGEGTASAVGTATGARLFPETGQSLSGAFRLFWEEAGGLPAFGLPLTGEREEIDESNGRLQTVQWFERARFEYHPQQAGTANAVQLTHLGRLRLASLVVAPTATTPPSAGPGAGPGGPTPVAATPVIGTPVAAATPTGRARFFPETGQLLDEPFRSYWESHGAVGLLGLPITSVVREISTSDGQERRVQYFERARLEEQAGGVQRGLLGRELLSLPLQLDWEAEESLDHSFTTAFVYAGASLGQDQALYTESSTPPPGADRYRASYRVQLPRPATYLFWGRLLDLGASSPLRWRLNGQPWQEVVPTLPAVEPVLLRHPHRYAWYQLGALNLAAGWQTVEIEVIPRAGGWFIAGLDRFSLSTSSEAPLDRAAGRPAQALTPDLGLQVDLGSPGAPWPRLHQGLAQGGEQVDPGYLLLAAPRIKALGTTYLRLDHIFDYYEIVQGRRRDRLTLSFSKLDAALDAVQASGAQPFISLGLTPLLLTPQGTVNDPPGNLSLWRELVRATVYHINIRRGLGVRYWEVWNEPNLLPFWSGTFEQYLDLYAETAAAVLSVDPNARIGGPAVAGHEYWVEALIDRAATANLPLDFVSWHTYHIRPAMLTNQVALIRAALARHERFQKTELIISEWNLHSDYGARVNFVTDTHTAGAYAVAMLQTMVEAGISQALFFEAIDGRPPDGQISWGRWGLLTYDRQPKPAYHAFTALSQLYDLRQPATSTDPRIGILATRQGEQIALVIWYLANEGQGNAPVQLTLRGAPSSLSRVRRWTVDATHSLLGGELEEVGELQGSYGADGSWRATLTLTPHSVTLLRG